MLKRIAVLTALLISAVSTSATAGRYKQPAYINNFYFCDGTIRDASGFPQPDRVVMTIAAERPVVTYFVLNLWADKGKHRLEIDFLDVTGKKFGTKKFNTITASADDKPIVLGGRFGGEVPRGGIFLKIYDFHKGKRYLLATNRLMTEVISDSDAERLKQEAIEQAEKNAAARQPKQQPQSAPTAPATSTPRPASKPAIKEQDDLDLFTPRN